MRESFNPYRRPAGDPHGESLIARLKCSNGRDFVRVATPCEQLGAANESFSRATRLGPSSYALKMGHEKATVHVLVQIIIISLQILGKLLNNNRY